MSVCGPRDIGAVAEQDAAAAHRAGNARLLAGPGTGKTRTIVELVLSLIASGDAAANEILCLTFTRAAAAGLRSKLTKALGKGNPVPEVYTLHGFALRQLLARHADLGAGTPRPRIADDWEERHIVDEDLKVILGEDKIKDVQARLGALAAAWETRPEDDPSTVTADAPLIGALEMHKREYGYILRSELVYLLKQTIDQNPGFRFKGDYKWVIVDEYQDLNRCDIAVIDEIAARGALLFVAGDDDQSIYQQMRHAHPDGIREFDTSHGAADLRLATCIRCDKDIIGVATSVIRQEVGRTDKRLDPHVTAGDGVVEALWFDDSDEEARGVADLAHSFVAAGIAPDQIMVLLRSDKHGRFSGPIFDAMQHIGVPSEVRSEADSTLDENPGRAVIAYLRLAIDDHDHLAWRTVLTASDLKLGPKAVEELHACSVGNGNAPLADVIDLVVADPSVCPSRGKAIVKAVETVRSRIDEVRAEVASTAEIGEQVKVALAKLALVFGDLTLVEGEIDSILTESAATDIAELLGQVSLSGDQEQEPIRPNTVNIMSMHKAKGLDACIVIVIAADEELVPGPNNRDEERRLFYVSLTRARHALFITHTRRRLGQQAQSGVQTGRDHVRTSFLNASGLKSKPGVTFVASYTPDLSLLEPLPNPNPNP